MSVFLVVLGLLSLAVDVTVWFLVLSKPGRQRHEMSRSPLRGKASSWRCPPIRGLTTAVASASQFSGGENEPVTGRPTGVGRYKACPVTSFDLWESELRPSRRNDGPKGAGVTHRRERRAADAAVRRRIALALVVLLCVTAGLVINDALRLPGSDGVAAELAEWGRDHGLNGLITWLEAVRYHWSQPPAGGEPVGGISAAAGALPGWHPAAAPLTPLVDGPALPREGQWQTVVAGNGAPAVAVTLLRPDNQHTSFLVGVMRLDPALVRGELHPGTRDPGGQWRASTSLAGSAGTSIAAAFDGGFRLNDPSHNGYYSEGRTVRPLIDGAASLVLRDDGTADVGAWNREVHMAPDVASVRQNLQPLVDDGQVNPACATGGSREWGSTIGQAAYIHRSGFGVTASGAEIYVGGPALSVCTLGQVLQDAGVARGMELDINPAWVSGTYFHGSATGPAKGFPLFPAEQVGPRHYYSPSSRDWYSWSLRPGTAMPTRSSPRLASGSNR
jgi:hypothetical protein